MRPMPLRAVSFLLYAYVAWRIAPDLGALWMSAAFVAVLVVSLLTLPYAFRARRSRPARRADRVLAWCGLVGVWGGLWDRGGLRPPLLVPPPPPPVLLRGGAQPPRSPGRSGAGLVRPRRHG